MRPRPQDDFFYRDLFFSSGFIFFEYSAALPRYIRFKRKFVQAESEEAAINIA